MSSDNPYRRGKNTLEIIRRLLELGFPPRWFRWVHHKRDSRASLLAHVDFCRPDIKFNNGSSNERTARRLDLLASEAEGVAQALELEVEERRCPAAMKPRQSSRLGVEEGLAVRQLSLDDWAQLIELVREELPPASGWPSSCDLHDEGERRGAHSWGPVRGESRGPARPGVYVVTPKAKEEHPVDISPSRIGVAAPVTEINCKFGRSVDLDSREKSYRRTFRDASPGGVHFEVLADLHIDDIVTVESAVLDRLRAQRKLLVNDNTGRNLEWLQGIDAAGVKGLAERVIKELRREGKIKE